MGSNSDNVVIPPCSNWILRVAKVWHDFLYTVVKLVYRALQLASLDLWVSLFSCFMKLILVSESQDDWGSGRVMMLVNTFSDMVGLLGTSGCCKQPVLWPLSALQNLVGWKSVCTGLSVYLGCRHAIIGSQSRILSARPFQLVGYFKDFQIWAWSDTSATLICIVNFRHGIWFQCLHWWYIQFSLFSYHERLDFYIH